MYRNSAKAMQKLITVAEAVSDKLRIDERPIN